MHTGLVERFETADLWEQFYGELHAFLRARVDSDESCQDLLQSAFLRAHRRLAAGDRPEHPRAWLYQIVRNLLIDARRFEQRQREIELTAAREPTVQEHSEAADERDAFALVARGLPPFVDALDPIYRDAIRMTELEGLTQAEAARRAGISLSGMKSRVQRGRQLVFDALQRCCAFEVDTRGRVMTCTPRATASECC